MCDGVCVCAITETPHTCEHIANIGIPLDMFSFLLFQWFFFYNVPVFGSLQTSLLCIIGELAGGGTSTVAVGASDRWPIPFCPFWCHNYYRHTSIDSVSPVCGIFFYLLKMLKFMKSGQIVIFFWYLKIGGNESDPGNMLRDCYVTALWQDPWQDRKL